MTPARARIIHPACLPKSQAFAWGSLGAIIPEVLRFFRVISTGEALPQLQWGLYAIVLIAFCLCAGAVGVAWRPDSEWKALWVGTSCPAIIATLIQAVPGLST